MDMPSVIITLLASKSNTASGHIPVILYNLHYSTMVS